MNPFNEFIRKTVENLESAKAIPLGKCEFPDRISPNSNAPVGIIFAPHPDDECISGGLPLRLYREAGFRIINIPITLGSDLARRDGRKKELESACRYLGFGIEFAVSAGFENICPEARENNTENWNFAVNRIVELLTKLKPQAIFFPHANDFHPTHCGTNQLVLDAMKKMPDDFSCLTVENEFWQAMERPNCLVELSEEIVSDLVCALSLHVGEVERNPYHVTFPSWLIDNVRRGSEIVGKAGGFSQAFTFGVLHKISVFKSRGLTPMFENGEFVSMESSLDWSASVPLA
jgi:LmbE family N-acetylglucosaminyl deacetylase